MLHYFKFRQELFDPEPAKDVYVKRGAGKGWPEECPPIRGANSFGFDLLANFDVSFLRHGDGTWRAEPDIELGSDFDWSANENAPARPLSQRYAWFWDRGQQIPHVITDDVFEEIRNQVKLSTFLFMATEPNETLLVTDLPNRPFGRPWRAMSALIETDWYPASYPWHVVLELDPSRERIDLTKGEPVARLIPLRRDTYFARPMSVEEFDVFFSRGQKWLATHGRPHDSGEEGNGTMDITRTYVKQQARSRFIVM